MTTAGTTLLRGIGTTTTVVFSITTTVPTKRLVASSGVGQRGWIIFSRYLSTGTARCTRAAKCRVGKGRRALRLQLGPPDLLLGVTA